MIPFYREYTPRFFLRAAAMVLAAVLSLASLNAFAEPARVLEDHPLAEKVWSSFTNQLTSVDDIVAAAEASHGLLLGEKHDNARHHEIQAELIRRMAAGGKNAAVIWEMIEPTKDSILAAGHGAKALGSELGWNDTGWPDWSEYAPIARVAITQELPMYGAALSRSRVRALLDDVSVTDGLAPRRLDQVRRDALLDQLEASHCGTVPRSALAGMANVQIARDGALARVIAKRIERGAYPIVNAGAGHTRRDRGIPWHLPRRTLLVVALVEVQRGVSDPAVYLEPGTADFIWFTPRVDEKDPCERFRR